MWQLLTMQGTNARYRRPVPGWLQRAGWCKAERQRGAIHGLYICDPIRILTFCGLKCQWAAHVDSPTVSDCTIHCLLIQTYLRRPDCTPLLTVLASYSSSRCTNSAAIQYPITHCTVRRGHRPDTVSEPSFHTLETEHIFTMAIIYPTVWQTWSQF